MGLTVSMLGYFVYLKGLTQHFGFFFFYLKGLTISMLGCFLSEGLDYQHVSGFCCCFLSEGLDYQHFGVFV